MVLRSNRATRAACFSLRGRSRRLKPAARAVVLLIPTVVFAAPPAKVALVGGRIIPVVGEDTSEGTLLIEHGRITAIGAEVKIPYDAMEVDVSGKVLFPGMIDPHSARGLDIPNESLPITPFLDVYDAIDPSRLFFENALRDGVSSVHVMQANNTVIGGLSRVVRPIGLSIAEMTVKEKVALKLSTTPKRGSDRMVQMATMREAFLELADYLERLAERRYEEDLKEKDKKIDVGPAEARKRGKELIRPEHYDDKHANLVKLTTGKMDAWIYAGAATDVGPAISTAKDNGFFDRLVLVLGPECFKAIGELQAAQRTVVLDPQLIYRERNPLTGKLKETFVPKKFADAGLTFALQPAPDLSLAERYLSYQAARCVRHGISRQTALEAITINPARMLGLGDELGSLEVGKIANVVVFSGDPLEFDSWVELVYIDGILAYDKSKDVRLEQLFGEEGDEGEGDSDEGKKGDSDEATEGDSDEGKKGGSEEATEGRRDEQLSREPKGSDRQSDEATKDLTATRRGAMGKATKRRNEEGRRQRSSEGARSRFKGRGDKHGDGGGDG